MYKKIDQLDIEFLESVVSKDRVISGEAISKDYAKDELGTVTNMPEVVVKVLSAEEIAKIMKYANDKIIPVTVRGSGTGLVGACVPVHGGIILDMTMMNKILSLEIGRASCRERV